LSERGVFALDRGWFEHPTFKREPFTEREAWAWLISEAAYKHHWCRVGSVSVEVARGQVAHSLRFMANKWKWAEPRVRRFLGRLKSDAMIDTQSDAGVTVITVRNYDKYQRVSLPTDASADAVNDAVPTQERRRVEGKEYKEEEVDGCVASHARVEPTTGKTRPEAYTLTRKILALQHINPDDLRAVGMPYTVHVWLEKGWKADIIEHAIASVIARKCANGEEAPQSLRYYEKAIARAHADASRPLPTATRSPTPRPGATRGGFAALAVQFARPIEDQRITIGDARPDGR
jgi:hypothetical protein